MRQCARFEGIERELRRVDLAAELLVEEVDGAVGTHGRRQTRIARSAERCAHTFAGERHGGETRADGVAAASPAAPAGGARDRSRSLAHRRARVDATVLAVDPCRRSLDLVIISIIIEICN
jgi:hypothetical protein